MLLLLLLIQHCYFYSYSLFDTTTLLAISCLTVLVFLLFLAQCCCSSWYSLLDIATPCLTLLLFLMVLCSFILDMACSGTSLVWLWCCYSLFVFPCSTLLLMFLLFQISISPPPPLIVFCRCGSYPNSNSLGQTWKVNVFSSIFIYWRFFILSMLFLRNFGRQCVYSLCARII